MSNWFAIKRLLFNLYKSCCVLHFLSFHNSRVIKKIFNQSDSVEKLTMRHSMHLIKYIKKKTLICFRDNLIIHLKIKYKCLGYFSFYIISKRLALALNETFTTFAQASFMKYKKMGSTLGNNILPMR